jgi:hypothetical protein
MTRLLSVISMNHQRDGPSSKIVELGHALDPKTPFSHSKETVLSKVDRHMVHMISR